MASGKKIAHDWHQRLGCLCFVFSKSPRCGRQLNIADPEFHVLHNDTAIEYILHKISIFNIHCLSYMQAWEIQLFIWTTGWPE